MKAAIRILTAERRWLSLALLATEREIDAGADLITESRLREQVRQLGTELVEVIEALATLKGETRMTRLRAEREAKNAAALL